MLLLHAGFPKTGTTSLQAAFASEGRSGRDTGYFGPDPKDPSLAGLDGRASDVNRFVRDIRNGRRTATSRRSFMRMRWRGRAPDSFSHVIVSEEMLSHSSGNGHTGHPELFTNVDRVLDVIGTPPQEVLLVLSLREAAELLPSAYAQARRQLHGRYPTVDDFLRAFLRGRLPKYEMQFRPDDLRAAASARGIGIDLIALTDSASSWSLGIGGLLDGRFPWSGSHPLPRLNARSTGSSWRSDPITAFDRAEVLARRLPIRRPPDRLYRALRRGLRRVTLAPETTVRPDPDLLAEIRLRFPPLTIENGLVR